MVRCFITAHQRIRHLCAPVKIRIALDPQFISANNCFLINYGKIRLLTGVKPGEKIVVQGIHKLGDGMRVRVVPASEFH